MKTILFGKLRLGEKVWFLKSSGSEEEVEQDVYTKEKKEKKDKHLRDKSVFLE